jgi:hypothetical protein
VRKERQPIRLSIRANKALHKTEKGSELEIAAGLRLQAVFKKR